MAETSNQPSPVTEMVIESNLLVINGYSVAKGIGIGNYIASKEFTVGGYKWKICFYPDGDLPESDPTYVAMYVALAAELKGGRSVQAMFEITLMDQSGNGKHKARTCFGRPLPHTLRRWVEGGEFLIPFSLSFIGYVMILWDSLFNFFLQWSILVRRFSLDFEGTVLCFVHIICNSANQ